jgi:hypothetical protein
MTGARGAARQSGESKGGVPRQIEVAFATVPYPGDDRLVENPADWEAQEIAVAFRGRHWTALPPEVLRCHDSSLTYFTPEAYRFYLPAYLLASLRPYDPSIDRIHIHQRVVWSLTPPKHNGPDMDRFLRKVSDLTPEQKVAVRDFLLWFVRKQVKHRSQRSDRTSPISDEEIALNRYWADFC